MGRIAEWLGLSTPMPAHTRDESDPPPSDPSSALSIPRRDASRVVTTSDAFGLSMIYRAIGIHVVATKQLSLGTFKDGKEVRSPLFIRQPDVAETRSAFLEQTVVSLACNGNAYWRIFRDDKGAVVRLEVLNPLDVTIDATKSGRPTLYKYQGGTELKPEEVKHLKLLRVPGSVYGLGPIQAAQHELRGALDLRDYSSNWFAESGIPNGVLKSDNVLSPDQMAAAKEAWNASQGARQGVAVLGNGLSYSPIFLNPKDAQFLESQQFSVTQIARLFGVPSSLMLATVEGSTDTYQNVSQDWLGYVRFSLMQYLIEIEDAFSTLLARGQEAKFNVEALLRSDTSTRYAAHKLALDPLTGWMTKAEVREIEHLAPLPEGTNDA